MVLRLADVLHNAVFLRTRPEVAAGADPPDRSLRWVHSTDVAQGAPPLPAGELAPTPGPGLPRRAKPGPSSQPPAPPPPTASRPGSSSSSKTVSLVR